MKPFLIGLLVVVLAAGGTFLYRDYYIKRKFRKLAEGKYGTVAPLIQRVTSRQEVQPAEILEVAGKPSLRPALFACLGSCMRLDLFPPEYMTYQKGAESCLVNWLEFPSELGIAPDEIELFEEVTLHDGGEAN